MIKKKRLFWSYPYCWGFRVPGSSHFTHPTSLDVQIVSYCPLWSGQWPYHWEKRDGYSWPKTVHIIQGSGLLGLDDREATVYVFCTSLAVYMSCRTKFLLWIISEYWMLRFNLQQFYISFCFSYFENNFISLVGIENDSHNSFVLILFVNNNASYWFLFPHYTFCDRMLSEAPVWYSLLLPWHIFCL